MAEHIFEQVAADMRRLTHPHLFRHDGAPQPAALATTEAVPHNGTQEDHMSLLDTLEAKARSLVADFESVDRAALGALERVQANPDTAAAFTLLDQLTHLPVGDNLLTTAISVLKMALSAASTTTPAPQPADVPQAAGPVIAGQA